MLQLSKIYICCYDIVVCQRNKMRIFVIFLCKVCSDFCYNCGKLEYALTVIIAPYLSTSRISVATPQQDNFSIKIKDFPFTESDISNYTRKKKMIDHFLLKLSFKHKFVLFFV